MDAEDFDPDFLAAYKRASELRDWRFVEELVFTKAGGRRFGAFVAFPWLTEYEFGMNPPPLPTAPSISLLCFSWSPDLSLW